MSIIPEMLAYLSIDSNVINLIFVLATNVWQTFAPDAHASYWLREYQRELANEWNHTHRYLVLPTGQLFFRFHLYISQW